MTYSLGVPPAFSRYIGIDYSGAETPTSSLKGLRVYTAERASPATELPPPAGPKKYWTRRGIAEWLAAHLAQPHPTLVGIDHGFSFPAQYFETHGLAHDWPAFLDDFHHHWPTDGDHVYVDFVREGEIGNGAARRGDSRWRRLTEMRARAKSVFHFNVQGTVAHSTHSGLPWLRFLRMKLRERVHFWPFDGWELPAGRTAIVEVYPALWSRGFARDDRDSHQHDAFTVATWLQQADQSGGLSPFLTPRLTEAERRIASIEGWILGIQ